MGRCAQNPPPCFSFWWWQTSEETQKTSNKNPKTIAKKWWQTSGRTQKVTKHPSQSPQKSLKIGSGTIPGALGGGSGTSLAPGRPRARKGHQKAAKVYSVFSIKMGTRSNFSWFFFNTFSWFWVPEDLILASILALLWELWASGKTGESVVKVVNFRGLAPARLSLFTGPDCGCVSVTFFCSFLWFLAVCEFPFWELLGLIAVKKEVWKKDTKKA